MRHAFGRSNPERRTLRFVRQQREPHDVRTEARCRTCRAACVADSEFAFRSRSCIVDSGPSSKRHSPVASPVRPGGVEGKRGTRPTWGGRGLEGGRSAQWAPRAGSARSVRKRRRCLVVGALAVREYSFARFAHMRCSAAGYLSSNVPGLVSVNRRSGQRGTLVTGTQIWNRSGSGGDGSTSQRLAQRLESTCVRLGSLLVTPALRMHCLLGRQRLPE